MPTTFQILLSALEYDSEGLELRITCTVMKTGVFMDPEYVVSWISSAFL